MGFVVSKTRKYSSVNTTTEKDVDVNGGTENKEVQEQFDAATSVNEDEENASAPSSEPESFTPNVVPSYSWLIATPVDLETTTKDLNKKTRHSVGPRSDRTSCPTKYYNGKFLKYYEYSAAELPPSNMKQKTPSYCAGSSACATHEANKETNHASPTALGSKKDSSPRRSSIPLGFGVVDKAAKCSESFCQGTAKCKRRLCVCDEKNQPKSEKGKRKFPKSL